MFNNVAIDVALGLIFIFLLYSLLSTVIQEIISMILGLRARTLIKAMRRMLEDGKVRGGFTLPNFFLDIFKGIEHYFFPVKPNTFLEGFYDYPLIKYLGENNWNTKPSYLTADNFSEAIIHLLRGDGFNNSTNQMALIQSTLTQGKVQNFTINDQTLQYLKKIWADSNNDIDKFKTNLEVWFNATMNRATGWYTRQSHVISWFIGLALAIAFNVDTIAIGKILATDDTAREQLVNMALSRQTEYGRIIDTLNKRVAAAASTHDTSAAHTDTVVRNTVLQSITENDSSFKKLYTQLESDAKRSQAILGLGRCPNKDADTVCIKKVMNELDSMRKKGNLTGRQLASLQVKLQTCTSCNDTGLAYQKDGSKWIGWLITAFAISLGAPFWFDMLNKIIALRGAGTKPENRPLSEKIKESIPVKRVG